MLCELQKNALCDERHAQLCEPCTNDDQHLHTYHKQKSIHPQHCNEIRTPAHDVAYRRNVVTKNILLDAKGPFAS